MDRIDWAYTRTINRSAQIDADFNRPADDFHIAAHDYERLILRVGRDEDQVLLHPLNAPEQYFIP